MICNVLYIKTWQKPSIKWNSCLWKRAVKYHVSQRWGATWWHRPGDVALWCLGSGSQLRSGHGPTWNFSTWKLENVWKCHMCRLPLDYMSTTPNQSILLQKKVTRANASTESKDSHTDDHLSLGVFFKLQPPTSSNPKKRSEEWIFRCL